MPKFDRRDIEQYYMMLGLNPREEGLIMRDSINLFFIGDLYKLNGFEKKLSYTSKELSDTYNLLINITKDEFWYETKKRREKAFQSAIDIVNDLTKFNIEDKNNEEMSIDRMNNLKNTIIKGLCSAGDLITFRMYQKNTSLKTIINKITYIENEEKSKEKLGIEEEKTPEDLMILYYLIAYSKFNNTGSDYEMFDGTGKVTLQRIRNLVRRNIKENVSLNNNQEREDYNNSKVLRLSNYKKNNNERV